MTPAAPNTYVVEKNSNASDGYTKEPVVGYNLGKANDDPVIIYTLQGQRRVLDGSAVMFPCGMVVDVLKDIGFATVEEWLEFNPETAKSVRSQNTVREAAKASTRTEVEGYDIEWTNKSFKNQSFWHYDDGTHEFCFILPGEENAPKQTDAVQKIKRVDMDKLKKRIDVLDIEDVKNPDILPDADPEEDDEEDEDDDGGLI